MFNQPSVTCEAALLVALQNRRLVGSLLPDKKTVQFARTSLSYRPFSALSTGVDRDPRSIRNFAQIRAELFAFLNFWHSAIFLNLVWIRLFRPVGAIAEPWDEGDGIEWAKMAVDRVTWQWLCGMPTPALCRRRFPSHWRPPLPGGGSRTATDPVADSHQARVNEGRTEERGPEIQRINGDLHSAIKRSRVQIFDLATTLTYEGKPTAVVVALYRRLEQLTYEVNRRLWWRPSTRRAPRKKFRGGHSCRGAALSARGGAISE